VYVDMRLPKIQIIFRKNNCVLDITFHRQILFFEFSLYIIFKINFKIKISKSELHVPFCYGHI